jgi:hypothetical protein
VRAEAESRRRRGGGGGGGSMEARDFGGSSAWGRLEGGRVIFAKIRGAQRASGHVFKKCSHLPCESLDGDQTIVIGVSIVSTGGMVST